MRRFVIWILCACLFFSSGLTVYADESDTEIVPETAVEPESQSEEPPTLAEDDVVSTEEILSYSDSCVVMDMDTGAVLYSKNMDRKEYPASITKILTGYLACQYLDMDQTITFNADALAGIDMYEDTNAGMQEGEQLTGDQALHAMMMISANEVANGIGIAVSGSIEDFAALMNETAAELGCENTHFTNPSGLHDDDHYTTAYDMALIASAAFKDPKMQAVFQASYYEIGKTNMRDEKIELYPQHKMAFGSDYDYEGCLGGKTGYTDEAGSTLVTYAQRGDTRLVCVAMKAYDWHHYTDTIQALDYCFDTYHKETVPPDIPFMEELAGSYQDLVSLLDFDGSVTDRNYFVPNFVEVDLPEGRTADELEVDFQPLEELEPAAPYDSYTYLCGTAEFTLDGQIMGKGPVYVNLTRIGKQTMPFPKKEELSNTRLINALEGLGSVEDDAGQPGVVSSLFSKIREKGVTPVMAAAGLFGVIVLFFLLSFIFHTVRRMRRRRNYKRLRKARLEEKAREEAEQKDDLS